MSGYLKRQLVAQNPRATLASRRTEGALYSGCLPQAASRGAHALALVREHASQSKGPCWTGYHRDYSKREGTNDSCVKDGSKEKKTKKTKKKKARKEGEGSGSSSSSSGEDEDGKPKKKRAKKDCDTCSK